MTHGIVLIYLYNNKQCTDNCGISDGILYYLWGPVHRVGESHHNAKLTDHDVELIRQLHEGGMKQKVIAKKFDCSPANISEIVNYRHRIGIGMGVTSLLMLNNLYKPIY